MAALVSILIFTTNKDTKGIYQSFSVFGDYSIKFADKANVNLQQALSTKVDLIIYEIMQPSLTEIEFVEQVFSINPVVPIVVVSGYFEDTKDTVFGNKIAGFVKKPLVLENLLSEIKKIVNKTAKTEIFIPELNFDNLHYENKKLSVLLEISRTLNAKTNLDELLSAIVDLACEVLNSERGTLFILDKKKKELWSKVGTGIEMREIRFPADKGIAGEVASTSRIINTSDPYSHPKFNSNIDFETGFKTRSLLCVPMKNFNNELIGVFELLNKKTGQFMSQDEEMLRAFATSTAIAIENAILHERLKEQIDSLQKSFNELTAVKNEIASKAKNEGMVKVAFYFAKLVSGYKQNIEATLVELTKQIPANDSVINAIKDINDCFDKLSDDFTAFIPPKH